MSVNEFIDIIYNNLTTNVAEIIEDKRKVIYEKLYDNYIISKEILH